MISVVIPLYNKARDVGRAVQSVLVQTHQAFEVIVVDDGSEDDGAAVVNSFSDVRVRLVRQPHSGVSAARNRGAKEAVWELVAFLDADDAYTPHFLATIDAPACAYPQCGAYATAYQMREEDGRIVVPEVLGIPAAPWEGIIPDYLGSLLGPQPVCSSAIAVPKRVLQQIAGFPLGVTLGEDLVTWLALLCYTPLPTAASAARPITETHRTGPAEKR